MGTHDNRPGLDERLRKLPAEIPPGRDLWPGIAARLGSAKSSRRATPQRSRWRPLAAAASVVFVAVLAVTVYRGDAPRAPELEPARTVASAAPVASGFGPGHELGSSYMAARAGLADDLERRLEALSPETRATVLENLATIRRAAAEIDAALGEDPANVLLQHQLLAAYQDELSVLANLQRVTERLPTRNEL
jgi:hypothetical protein